MASVTGHYLLFDNFNFGIVTKSGPVYLLIVYTGVYIPFQKRSTHWLCLLKALNHMMYILEMLPFGLWP